MIEFFTGLGVWTWFLIGLILLIGEVVLPGIFLIWFGAAALVVGTLTILPFTDVSWWPWQAQLAVFGLLSLIFVLVSRKVFPNAVSGDSAEKLNAPLRRLHGREASLDAPITMGVGKIKLGDTMWRVKGPDLPTGSRIKVIGDDGDSLIVEGESGDPHAQ